MFIFKAIGVIAKLGGKIIDWYEDAMDFVDHLIHKKEYERQAKRRKLFWTILLSVLGGIIVVLFFPYRLIVKRNGDFEIRTLLLRVYRRSEVCEASEDDGDGCDTAEAVAAEDAVEA